MERMFKVLVIGDSGVGKTAFVNQYVSGHYRGITKQTFGVAFALKVIQWTDAETVRLQLWDIAGQERFTSMTRVYYKNSAGCVLMFDITDRQSFHNVVKWKRDLDSKVSSHDGDPIPCILLANKTDLVNRAISYEEIQRLSQEHDFLCWTEVSVKNNVNISESMRYLIKAILSNETDFEMSMAVETGSYLDLGDAENEDEPTVEKKRRCCFS
ncbi:ras-related protein Rab-7L1-like [Corticium candelabrum]|uniref:ras-related protein Rab-7L1-like n=1 Tax=Corticium candelabrum TaxID=121492 RepID=UPI002E25E710|nr:ras-related protein Rab-7L1-like [Corticium candelabrum]